MPKLTTSLCRLLGITLPIIQAPITASPEVVAAVSNCGGLGLIQATWPEIDDLRHTIARLRRLTGPPFRAHFRLAPDGDQRHANPDAALAGARGGKVVRELGPGGRNPTSDEIEKMKHCR